MVEVKRQLRHEPWPSSPEKRLGTTVSLSRVISAGLRLEASGFNIEATNARKVLHDSGLSLSPLSGPGGLAAESHNAFRFKRIFVDEQRGIPFLPSSEIISMRPRTEWFLSRKQTAKIDRLVIKPWDVLISCSGTIGNVALAGRSFSGKALSQDAIRVRFEEPDLAGFIAAFLRTKYGRLQLQSVTYGSVIVHIEPEHLQYVLVPDIPPIKRVSLGRMFVDACKHWDRANDLLDEADILIHQRLGLPPIAKLAGNRKRSLSVIVRTSALKSRLDASYHDALAEAAEAFLRRLPSGFLPINDPSLVKEVRPVTKFRKRVYVPQNGIPLLSSKQLFQIDPIDIKQLGKKRHTKDLVEIALKENMLALTCSGTIGRVQIIPKYMTGWAANQHAIRLIAIDDITAGYLFAWLASDYGYKLISRHSYGSVIKEIDKNMLSSVPVPNASETVRREIGELVLEANRLRNEAWSLEKKAISHIEAMISKGIA